MRLSQVYSLLFVLAAATGPATAQDADLGAELYGDYCAACHGTGGKGDGDMADVVTIPAPDLTTLASRNDGEFPMLQVIHVIDGRTGVRAHGGPMPLFGRVFSRDGSGEGSYGTVLETRGRVLSLALYLESLQQ
jgi:mono/diheme cytochrome c family protein